MVRLPVAILASLSASRYGALHEEVYDIAWAGKRKLDGRGKLPPIGSTVNLSNASYANTIGAAELRVVWRNPDFDPAERAFYYARIPEIPTPMWGAYDARFYGVKKCLIRWRSPPLVRPRSSPTT